MPLGTEKAALMGAGAGGPPNYYGDESDGAVTTSGDVTHTVLNKDGSYDGDMFIAQYSALTISTGDTMTVDQPCRGLFIYVTGDLTVNGTLTMKRRGAFADPTASGGSDSNAVPTDGLVLGLFDSSGIGGTDTFTNDGTGFDGSGTAVRTAIANQDDLAGDGTKYRIIRVGGAGGAKGISGGGGQQNGTDGDAGTTGAAAMSTGGGGGGRAGGYNPGPWSPPTGAQGGDGGVAGCFGGGAGGGGAVTVNTTGGATGGDGVAYGGAGGNAACNCGGPITSGGGSGNPAGSGIGASGTEDGCGGIIWLVVGGNVTVGASGVISTEGGESDPSSVFAANGGGSGAGCIFILNGGTYTNNGSVTSPGGNGRGDGGNGGVYQATINEA